MFKKLNSTRLMIILLVVGGIVAFNKLYTGNKDESTFRQLFVEIDSASVKNIFIYPHQEKGKEIKIVKNGTHWDLQNDKIKTIADTQAVGSLLSMFKELKAVSLGGENSSSWNDLQVSDTAGSRIKFETTDNKTFNIVVGKFSYNNRNGLTYVRHSNEEGTYAVNGFLSFTVDRTFDSWRVHTFLKSTPANYSSLTFTYPADSSFQLNKTNNVWFVNGEKADSAKTESFINALNNLQSQGFEDGYSNSLSPLFSLIINGSNQSPITIKAYQSDAVKKFILNSSQNPLAYFREDKSNLVEKIFVSKQKFLLEETKTK